MSPHLHHPVPKQPLFLNTSPFKYPNPKHLPFLTTLFPYPPHLPLSWAAAPSLLPQSAPTITVLVAPPGEGLPAPHGCEAGAEPQLTPDSWPNPASAGTPRRSMSAERSPFISGLGSESEPGAAS